VHTDEEKEEDVSISELEYCCISIMHHPLRHALLTTPIMSDQNGSRFPEKLASVNRTFPFDSCWNMNQPISTMDSGATKFMQV